VGTQTTWQEGVKIILAEQLQHTIYFLKRNSNMDLLLQPKSKPLTVPLSIGLLLYMDSLEDNKIQFNSCSLFVESSTQLNLKAI